MKNVMIYFTLIFFLLVMGKIIDWWQFGHYISSFLFFIPLILPGIIFRGTSIDWFQKELFKDGFLKSIIISFLSTSILLTLFHFSWKSINLKIGFVLEIQINPTWIGDFKFLVLLNLMAICIVEEMVFRGYIQEELSKNQENKLMQRLVYQILIPAILFSIMHIFSLQYMCWIIIFPGIYFSLLKFITKHVSGPILAHLLFNLYYLSLNSPKPF